MTCEYVLTSSIFSSDVLIVSADYLHHLQPNEWDPFDKEFIKATWLNLRKGGNHVTTQHCQTTDLLPQPIAHYYHKHLTLERKLKL